MDSKIPPSLRRVISEQADVVSRQQLLRAGVSRTTIDSRLQRGIWQQFHPGVYGAFTGAPRWEARLWAAVLYAGPGAMLSHETAAEILGLTSRRYPIIQLTVPARRRVHPQEGLAIHRSTLEYPRWRPLRGVPPHTFYAETIIDLAGKADNLDDVVGWAPISRLSSATTATWNVPTASPRPQDRRSSSSPTGRRASATGATKSTA